MSLNKYGCLMVNTTHTAIIPNGHRDPTFLHTCAKTQKPATATSHISAIITFSFSARRVT